MRFAGKVAVVTGAASGIGRAAVLKLAGEGAHVFAADIDEAGGRVVFGTAVTGHPAQPAGERFVEFKHPGAGVDPAG